MIVDGVEKFKPDYWDRVVCVFTTGQPWQFKDYKWREPHALFQNVRGVIVQHTGEEVPASAKNWNIVPVRIERGKRYRDLETAEGFWEGIERWMEARGKIRRD